MALQKVDYVNQVTVITAENMNDIQDAIIALETAPSQGLSEEVKQALLQLAEEVAYASPLGQAVYTDLYNAFYPPVQVVSITAVFEQGITVIYDDTALNDLKQYLTVTARYDDNTTAILADSVYSLSGTLAAGTSTVTVTYNSVTTTFAVNVTARPTLSSITAVYTQSGTVYDTDTLDSLKADLVVTAVYSDSSTAVIPSASYTLSGTLTVGTSTITVSYGGKTTTFSVTVTEDAPSVNYIEVGTPNIVDGILTTSDGNFVKTPEAFSPGNSSWSIIVKFMVNGEVDFQDVFGGVDSSNASVRSILLELAKSGSQANLFVSSDTTSWDVVPNLGLHWNYLLNEWVWFKFEYDGNSTYKITRSTDGVNYVSPPSGGTKTSTGTVIDGYPIAFGLSRAATLNGQIDLNACEIYIGGQLWWKAISERG